MSRAALRVKLDRFGSHGLVKNNLGSHSLSMGLYSFSPGLSALAGTSPHFSHNTVFNPPLLYFLPAVIGHLVLICSQLCFTLRVETRS